MGVVQAKQAPIKMQVSFDHVPIDRYEQLITRYRLLINCAKQAREHPNNVNLRNKFAVMATQYLERGHSDVHVTQEISHRNRVIHVLAMIEELCPQQDNITEEQATARSFMLCESVVLGGMSG